MPGYAAADSRKVDIFVDPAGVPYRKPIDEETAKQLNADRELSAKLMNSVERYKNSDEGQKADASNAIREVVSKQFEVRQHLRERELAELEARLGKLRELHAKRQQQKDQIINDRVQQVLRDADGLGWGDATPGGDVFFFKNGGGATLFGAPGGGAPVPVSEDMMIKVQAAKADAANQRGEAAVPEPVIAGAKVVIDPETGRSTQILNWDEARRATEKAIAESQAAAKNVRVHIDLAKGVKWEAAIRAADAAIQKAREIAPGEARDQAVRDAEQARRDAEQELRNIEQEARQEAEQARDEAFREAEQARLEAMKEVAEARAEVERAAKEAQEEAARQEGEANSESWEEHP